MSGTLHAGLISTNPEESWQKTCRSLPPLGSVERPWKFTPSSVLTAPLPIKCKPHNAVREVRIIAPAAEETEAKVVKDFVKLKTEESSRKPTHQCSLGCRKHTPPDLPMLSPWEDRLHGWGVTTVTLSFLKGRQEHEVTKCLGKHFAFPAGLLTPPNTDCSVGYPYQLTGLIFPFAYETSAFVHDRLYCLYHIAESHRDHWMHCSELMYLNSTINCNDQSGKKRTTHTEYVKFSFRSKFSH